ncbi:hypothetical protein [Mycobacterium sp.]
MHNRFGGSLRQRQQLAADTCMSATSFASPVASYARYSSKFIV